MCIHVYLYICRIVELLDYRNVDAYKIQYSCWMLGGLLGCL